MAKKVDIFREAAMGNIALLSAWIAAGNDPNLRDANGLPPLHFAAYRGRAEMVQFLLEHGAEVNVSNDIGYTPLMVASREGYSLETVRLLIKAGADVNVATFDGQTALMCAVDMSSNTDIVAYLSDRGANINGKTQYGFTPLMYAAFRGSIDMARLLVNRGSDISACNQNGGSVLAVAVKYNHEEVAQYLRSCGAIDAPNS